VDKDRPLRHDGAGGRRPAMATIPSHTELVESRRSCGAAIARLETEIAGLRRNRRRPPDAFDPPAPLMARYRRMAGRRRRRRHGRKCRSLSTRLSRRAGLACFNPDDRSFNARPGDESILAIVRGAHRTSQSTYWCRARLRPALGILELLGRREMGSITCRFCPTSRSSRCRF